MREQYLIHWRTKGSKNGERRYQYKDGTYTPLGKARRRVGGFWDDVDTIFSKRNFREDTDYDDMHSKDARYGKGSPQKVEDKYKNDYYESKSKRQVTEDDSSQSDQQNERQEQPKQQAQPKQEKKQEKQQDKQEQAKQDQKKDKNQSNPPKYDTVFKDASKLTSSLQKITKVKAHNKKVDARNAEIAQMTDKELEEVNKRLGLEKRYKELLDNKASEKAKVEVSDILEAFGNTVAVIQDLSAIGRAILQEKDN